LEHVQLQSCRGPFPIKRGHLTNAANEHNERLNSSHQITLATNAVTDQGTKVTFGCYDSGKTILPGTRKSRRTRTLAAAFWWDPIPRQQ